MKLTVLFLLLNFNLFGQGWTVQELDKANTCKNVKQLNVEEKKLVQYINLMRMYPQKYLRIELPKYIESISWSNPKDSYYYSLVDTLKKMEPRKPLTFDSHMWELASCHVKDLYKRNEMSHDRKGCHYGWSAECISAGVYKGDEICGQLLHDRNVKSLGHRYILISWDYTKIGVSMMTSKDPDSFWVMTVLDFQ